MYLSGRVSASGQEVKGTTPSCGLNLLGSKHRELARKRKKISRIVRLNIYIYLISLDFFFFKVPTPYGYKNGAIINSVYPDGMPAERLFKEFGPKFGPSKFWT